jgi:hypothetical protein
MGGLSAMTVVLARGAALEGFRCPGHRMCGGRRRVDRLLRLDLRNGTRFAVTVDDPERPAALVNGLLERRTYR